MVSNCVLNLVHDSDKEQLIQEIFRVVKPDGRVIILDIVSDECVPRKTYNYNFVGIAPAEEHAGKPWHFATDTIRAVAETKGGQHQDRSNKGGDCC